MRANIFLWRHQAQLQRYISMGRPREDFGRVMDDGGVVTYGDPIAFRYRFLYVYGFLYDPDRIDLELWEDGRWRGSVRYLGDGWFEKVFTD